MNAIKVGGGCLNQTPLDWQGNLNRIITAINIAKKDNLFLLCLPELAISGYGCEDAFLFSYVTERAAQLLIQIADATEGLAVCVGLPLMHQGAVWDVAAMIADRQIIGFVPKRNLAGDGIHYEPRWFKPWQSGVIDAYSLNGYQYPIGDLLFVLNGIKVGIEICEDAWAANRPAARYHQQAVDVILNPSASHFAFGKAERRRHLVTESSRAFCCTYVYANLLGNEAGRAIYDGHVMIADNGGLIADSIFPGYQDLALMSAWIDPNDNQKSRKSSFSYQPKLPTTNFVYATITQAAFETRKPETTPHILIKQSKEEEFLSAATLGLWDYMRKSRSQGFVLSLSGGADSSLCAVLIALTIQRAWKELGAAGFTQAGLPNFETVEEATQKLLTCIYQATENSTESTENSAHLLAEAIGASYHYWDIANLHTLYLQLGSATLKRPLCWDTDDISLQNIQARVRAPGIWLVANLKKALLIATSNRSEASVGYTTMDGDTAGGLAPIAGIDKHFIRQWLQWAENALPLPSLSYVNNLTPTAELRPHDRNQTDEDDLMPYTVLNAIERCAIQAGLSPIETYQKLVHSSGWDAQLLKRWIKRFYTLWAINQWKRERFAPSFHYDDYNVDPRSACRFPILNGGFQLELQELDDES